MIKLAIDMGSSMTKIYRADTNSGIVLAEPSCVAVVTGEQIKAIGKEAKSLIGKTAEFTSIIYPVYEGEIVNMRLAEAMLKEFLSRIDVKASALRRAQVLFSVPCGISEKNKSEHICIEANRILDSCRDRDCFEDVKVILTDFGSEICKDAGENSLGQRINLAGKIFILFLTTPLILSILEITSQLF